MSKFQAMKKHIELREQQWGVKYTFIQRLRGYIEMGLFVSKESIVEANKNVGVTW